MGWVGPLLKQCSYATYDANKLSVRAGGGDAVTARPGLAKLQREGRVDPASEVGGEWQAPPWTLRLAPAGVAAAQAGQQARGAGKDAAPAAAWGSWRIRRSPGAPLPPAAELPPGRLQRH